MVEEIEDLKVRVKILENISFSDNNEFLQASEQETLTSISTPRTYQDQNLPEEIQTFKKDLSNLNTELRSFKNIVACLIVCFCLQVLGLASQSSFCNCWLHK